MTSLTASVAASGNNGRHRRVDGAAVRLRRFLLCRHTDVSGVSGTGVVAEGVRLSDGRVVLAWLRVPHAIAIYGSIGELLRVHGHEGSTSLEWIDEVWRRES